MSDDAESEARIQIWATPGLPLRLSEIKTNGMEDLKSYAKMLEREMVDPHKKYAHLPLASFGSFNPKTGVKQILQICKDYEDLPTKDIPGVLIFD